ncbi:MAG: hypothetical protein N2Z74_02205 [Syntrophales bacterium]|nr:hypothetical protein [Syntrophales bacterium]
MMTLFNRTVDVLTGMLNYRAKRHQVILSNVANMDVPDYRPSDLVKKESPTGGADLVVKPRTTHKKHIGGLFFGDQGVSYEVTTFNERVSLDKEMTNLSENNLMYNATIEMLARKLRSISTVVKETK